MLMLKDGMRLRIKVGEEALPIVKNWQDRVKNIVIDLKIKN